MLGIVTSLLFGARDFESRGGKDLRGIQKLLPGVRWGEGRGGVETGCDRWGAGERKRGHQ